MAEWPRHLLFPRYKGRGFHCWGKDFFNRENHFSGKAEEKIDRAEEKIDRAEEKIGRAEEKIGLRKESFGLRKESFGLRKESFGLGNNFSGQRKERFASWMESPTRDFKAPPQSRVCWKGKRGLPDTASFCPDTGPLYAATSVLSLGASAVSA